MFKRDIEISLKKLSKFPAIAILGPRQSGKTTLVKINFKNHKFYSFEDPTIREFAQSDPKRFLSDSENKFGIILDEFQYVPELLSYIQLDIDNKKRPGYFILTGSQNFLMNQAITQTLAGRIGILTLLPLSLNELKENNLIKENNIDNVILNGFYPRLYAENFSPTDLYPSYIHTYIERDVRQLTNVGDLRTFQKFLGLCAGRIGQLLNLSDLATNCGISVPTASKWISILEASYVIFILQPYFNNFNKRLTKSPKLYFYDTGIACNLLGISSDNILSLSPFRGHLFENLIISDLKKQFYNYGITPPIYFWRDQNGRTEIDCLIDYESNLIPIEIKSSQTISMEYFKNLIDWGKIAQSISANNYIIYAGDTNQTRSSGNIINWESSANLIKKLYKF